MKKSVFDSVTRARGAGCFAAFVLSIAALSMATMAAGCAAHNTYTGLPTGVTNAQVNAWATACNYLVSLTSITHTTLTAVYTANKTLINGKAAFPDGPHYIAVLRTLGGAVQFEEQANQFLQTVPNNFGQPIQQQIQNYTTQIIAQLTSASGEAALGISDQNTAGQIASDITQGLKIGAQITALIKSFSAPGGSATPSSAPPTSTGAADSQIKWAVGAALIENEVQYV